MVMLIDSAVFRHCSPLLTRLTLASPTIADKAALLTFPNRNRFRVGDYSGQTTSCCFTGYKPGSVTATGYYYL